MHRAGGASPYPTLDLPLLHVKNQITLHVLMSYALDAVFLFLDFIRT